jgi:nucleoside 2-deoxyribosyltransferase
MEMRKCFVIASIRDENSHERNKINDLIDNYFRPILPDYQVEISHQISTIGRITSQVINKIFQSDLIIADITDINGNVMYELGVADTLQKPVIIICETKTKLPFDKYDQRTIMYDYLPYAMKKFEMDFKKAVNSLKTIDRVIENTVTQSIGIDYLTQNIDFSQITKDAAYSVGVGRQQSSKLIHTVKEYFDEIKSFDIEKYTSSVNGIFENCTDLFNEKIVNKVEDIRYGDFAFDYKIELKSRTIFIKIIKSLAMVTWSIDANKIIQLQSIYPELSKKTSHPIFIIPQIKNAGKSRKGISMLKFDLKKNIISNYDIVLQDLIVKEKTTDNKGSYATGV